MTRIKICGITNLKDAHAAVESGADALGFIFAPSPRRIDVEEASRIAWELPPFIVRVGVFVDEDASVMEVAKACGLDAMQLHEGVSEQFARDALAQYRVLRAVRVKNAESLLSMKDYSAADAYLLDTHVDGMSGGTGKTFDWDLAIEAQNCGKPIIIAGGLNPDNILEAITRIRPYAVDVSSGVESSPGKKDHVKLKELIDNVRSIDGTA